MIATCSSSDKAHVLQGLGAHRIINYRDEVSRALAQLAVPCCSLPGKAQRFCALFRARFRLADT